MEKVFKNICITGAGNGIGRAIAIAMSKEGYNVVCADIDLNQANETLEIILDNNGNGLAIEMDVNNSSDIKKMIKDTVLSPENSNFTSGKYDLLFTIFFRTNPKTYFRYYIIN